MITKASITFALLAVVAGCSDGRPSRVPVSGQVLIDGAPLPRGNIRFVPADARPSGGKIGDDGRFTLTCYDRSDGAVLGRHAIEISSNEPVGPNAMRWFAPKKYANYETSGLEQKITGPTESLIIDLTWSGGQPFVEQFSGVERPQ